MASKYDYVLYMQDGTKREWLGVEKQTFEQIKVLLDCDTLEPVPRQYIDENKDMHLEGVTDSETAILWGNEEARFVEGNKTNHWFKVIKITPEERAEETRRMKEFFGENFESIVNPASIDENGVETWDIVGNILLEKELV